LIVKIHHFEAAEPLKSIHIFRHETSTLEIKFAYLIFTPITYMNGAAIKPKEK